MSNIWPGNGVMYCGLYKSLKIARAEPSFIREIPQQATVSDSYNALRQSQSHAWLLTVLLSYQMTPTFLQISPPLILPKKPLNRGMFIELWLMLCYFNV